MANEPTIRDVMVIVTDILETLNAFSTHVDKCFDGLEKRVGNLENEMKTVNTRLNTMQFRLDGFQSSMVTKDYMEGRLAAMSR